MPLEGAAVTAFADVSVVMPAWRAAATIARALLSVAGQTVKPSQVIVVDDGSDDTTFTAAEAMRGTMEGIALVVLRQPHQGAGAARNRAIAEARGTYLAFLDADDEWLPDKLALSLAEIEASGAVLVAHDLALIEGGRERVFDCRRHFAAAADPYAANFLRGFIATSTVLARRDAVLAAGGFDATLPSGQDYELWLRVTGAPGARFRVFAGALTRNHVTQGSISSRVALRRRCAMAILLRHARAEAGRRRVPARVAMLRAAIIHAQAAIGHARQGERLAAVGDCLLLPGALTSLGWSLARRREAANPFIGARRAVDAETTGAQERNRLWWERMPMTYADWQAERRLPASAEDLHALAARVLEGSPFLRQRFDFRAFADRRVLDLGCGSGIFACLFAKGGASAVAVDLTQAAVELAAETARAHGVAVAIARMDAEALAFPDGTFDFVYSWGVLHHTRDMERAFAEAARVLAPGGGGMVMVYHRRSLVYYGLGLYWLIARGKLSAGHTLASVQDFYTDGYYHRYLTRAEMARLLGRAGLAPSRISVTQYEKKLVRFLPRRLDDALKARFGMCLVAEFTKPRAPSHTPSR